MAIARTRTVRQVTVVQDDKTVTKTAVILTAKEQVMLEAFLRVRSEETQARKEKEALSAQLKEIIGESDVALVDGVVRVEILRYPRVTIDQKLLLETFSEAYEATARESIISRIQAK